MRRRRIHSINPPKRYEIVAVKLDPPASGRISNPPPGSTIECGPLIRYSYLAGGSRQVISKRSVSLFPPISSTAMLPHCGNVSGVPFGVVIGQS